MDRTAGPRTATGGLAFTGAWRCRLPRRGRRLEHRLATTGPGLRCRCTRWAMRQSKCSGET